jgi:ferritin-like metal-binding protein YciE
MKKPMNLNDLLIMKIQALYDIELQLVKAIPKLVHACTDEELAENLSLHLNETKEQVERLERIFDILGTKPAKLKAEAIRGLADDADWVTKNVKEPLLLDIMIIAAASYVEHYEIAGYTTASAWAAALNEDEIADLLNETLAEEKAASDLLSEKSDKLVAETM